MKIAINATSAVSGGGVTYIKNILHHLSKLNTSHQYVILVTAAGKEVFYFQHPNFEFLPLKIPSINSIFRVLWEQFALQFFLKKEGIDVLFSPGNICPLFSIIPNVVMIQNLAPFSIPIIRNERIIQKFRLKLLRRLTVTSIKKSKKVIFISKKAICDMKKLGLSLKHANLIYHGKNEDLFHANINEDRKQQILNKYNLKKFILYVSNIHRYKNFFELIQAFSKICNKINTETKLVLAGRCFDDGYYNEMVRFVRENGIEERVFFLGDVPYGELPHIYAACELFVYPSTCENCPNILIEAMACGAPILSSNIEPMPEMCADAAIYFDPTSPASMADLIFKTIMDKNLLSTLKTNSLKRAEYFSWEDAATKTLKVFESII